MLAGFEGGLDKAWMKQKQTYLNIHKIKLQSAYGSRFPQRLKPSKMNLQSFWLILESKSEPWQEK